jgi:ribose transport system ATP-binding protein
MVTHKLSEILLCTNRVMVIIDGELVSDGPTQGLDRFALVEQLRQNVTEVDQSLKPNRAPSEVLIEMCDAQVAKLAPINLRLNSGEVVGISGMPGSGLHEIALAVSGAALPRSGRVDLLRPGLKRALVPPHRESQGGFAALSVRENMSIGNLRRWRGFGFIINRKIEKRECELVVEELAIRPRSSDAPFDQLSGGNKQKVIFGRALLRQPDFYVLCEPTRGVDVGTRSEIYRIIREIVREGAGVLVASSDAEDLFSVCDRVGLIVNGALQPLCEIADLSESELEMMV